MPRSAQSLNIVPLRGNYSIIWIPACAGMTGTNGLFVINQARLSLLHIILKNLDLDHCNTGAQFLVVDLSEIGHIFAGSGDD